MEIIRLTGARIARLAALRMCVCALGPALTAFLLAALLYPIGEITWTRWGYMLTADRAEAIIVALLGAGVISLIAGATMAYRDYRRANDFMGAAGRLDELLEGDQQIVTLATLADPSAPDAVKSRRTPLFPVLWRHAIAYFEGFDPVREFRFDVREPIRRSSIFAGVVAGAMVLATLGLMQAPSPEQSIAGKLRAIASEIEASPSSPEDSVLAAKIRAAADAIENPQVPPEQKKERIKEAMQQADKAAQKRNNSASGKDQGTGTSKSSNGNSNGTGNSKNQGQSKSGGSGGSGEGKSGTGEGKGQGKSGSGKGDGSGNNASAKNEPGKGSDKNEKNGNKGDQQNVELQNELAKADAQVETAGAKNPGSGADDKSGKDKDQPNPNQPGNNPNQKGPDPSRPNPDMAGNLPKPGEHGDRNIPGGGKANNGKDRGSNQGDTHLGETPSGTNAQRYLKPGEKGATLDIKDARYVMFRIPSATPSGDGGKTVLDTGRPKATTAYVNAPLAPSSDNAPPDERQLVPPRYRDMIH